jgi:mono/diheme cytochrome c family protein
VDVIALGDQTFHDTCARCHGPDGTGGLSMPAFATVLSDLQVRP